MWGSVVSSRKVEVKTETVRSSESIHLPYKRWYRSLIVTMLALRKSSSGFGVVQAPVGERD